MLSQIIADLIFTKSFAKNNYPTNFFSHLQQMHNATNEPKMGKINAKGN